MKAINIKIYSKRPIDITSDINFRNINMINTNLKFHTGRNTNYHLSQSSTASQV